jgi:hypothetical protein
VVCCHVSLTNEGVPEAKKGFRTLLYYDVIKIKVHLIRNFLSYFKEHKSPKFCLVARNLISHSSTV